MELSVTLLFAVKVPVPERVPFRTIEFGIVGAAPKGSEQLLLIVFVFVCPVKETRLNAIELQVSVAVEPENRIVPALWANVPPVTLNVLLMIVVALLAVNAPPLSASVANVTAWLDPLKFPFAWLKVVIEKVRATVIVPEYPEEIVKTEILAGALASITESFADVASKITVSAATGQMSEDQFAQVLQFVSPPPPSQVRVAALMGSTD